MGVKSYRDLLVWQKAMDLVAEVYRLTEGLPDRERFGLTNQARRTAVAIPSHIADGQGRGNTTEYVRFIRMARGSIQELETHLLLTVKLSYCTEDVAEQKLELCAEVSRMLSGLERALSQGASS